MVDNASSSLQYRIIKDLLGPDAGARDFSALAYSNLEAIRLAVAQQADGLWNRAILSVPEPGTKKPERSVGTAAAVHRLLELGWEREAPPFQAARRPLFRLLAEDTDPGFVYELASLGEDAEAISWSRSQLRGGAAAALAHAGHELDPRLRGAAQRHLARVEEHIGSSMADDPWVKLAGTNALSPDAFPPTLHTLLMLAWMPAYRVEHDDLIDRLTAYFARPMPRHAPMQAVGARALPSPYVLLGDPLSVRSVAEGDIGFTVFWLELVARLGMLKRHEGWQRHFSRLLDSRDRDLVWRAGKGQPSDESHALTWPFADLRGRGAAGREVEVTFRLAQIARLAGYTVDFV
jgi:hypothetical protein